MANLWRLQKNTDGNINVGEYCIANSVVAVGWSLNDNHLKDISPDDMPRAKEKRSKIQTFQEYESFVHEYSRYDGKVNSSVKKLYSSFVPDDLIWLRQNGVYYLGRVTEKSHWFFNHDVEALEADASNQLSDVEWLEVGDEGKVPGAISTSMIRGKTIQRIWKTSMLEYSQLLYNAITGTEHYRVVLPFDSDTFFNLFSTEDCEDLLCMWLYHKYGYVCIPSTNKRATELYECVLIDPRNGNHIFPQAKAGKVDIYTSDYQHLDGEVWLFTTKGSVVGTCGDTIHAADPEELFRFIASPEAKTILPDSILRWYNFLKSVNTVENFSS